eukprot:GSChrysophyteH1.ASY1.ANO1.2173.1 assembled CDS
MYRLLIVYVLAAYLARNAHGALEARTDTDREASLFKVPGQDGEEEWAMLPEVMSNLDFFADSSPATEDDIEGQKHLRSTRFWGRLYIEGWPQTIQFFRAHFGSEPPMGRKTFVFAEPRDACGDLSNAQHLTEEHIVLANRGSCTYGTKAKNVMKTGASAIVIINNEPGLDHLPGPDAHDIDFSVSSIPQQEGQLIEAIYDEGLDESSPFGRGLHGYMVPINCENSGARCVPATFEERRMIRNMKDGGHVQVDSVGIKDADKPMEYLLAHFGTKVTESSNNLDLVVARPAEACTPIENNVKGKAVLVRRGGCPFVKKAEEVQNAGGRVIILGNNHAHIVRMGVEPRWKGLDTIIPVVMVSKRTYGILVAEAMSSTESIKLSLNEHDEVSGEVWEPIEKLAQGSGWPRSDAYVTKKYQELIEEHAGFPDRLASIEGAYAAKKKSMPASKKAEKSEEL